MVATGTIRTAVETRLMQLVAGLDQFSATVVDGKYFVTQPFRTAMPARRLLVIGRSSIAQLDPEDVSRALEVDSWTISCGLAVTAIAEPVPAKTELETAFNAIADLLATDPTLGMPDGPRDLLAQPLPGPFFEWLPADPGPQAPRVPTGWWDFEISCNADITRSPL